MTVGKAENARSCIEIKKNDIVISYCDNIVRVKTTNKICFS